MWGTSVFLHEGLFLAVLTLPTLHSRGPWFVPCFQHTAVIFTSAATFAAVNPSNAVSEAG